MEHTVDAVLPLTLRDVERVEKLLLPSFGHFFHGLGVCWVVAPDAECQAIAQRITDPRFTVVSELDLIPELRLFGSVQVGGWFVQQVIKLTIARIVTSPFYLTLDADVLCVRRTVAADLIKNNRSEVYVYSSESDIHGHWYDWSARVLRGPRSRLTHGVTPVVLSTEGVQRLLAHFEERLAPNALRAECYLLAHLPWTEYALYFTFLENAGLFDTYHVPATGRISGNNIWRKDDAAAWEPALSFSDDGEFPFTVLQSYAVHQVDAAIARIRAYFVSQGMPSPF